MIEINVTKDQIIEAEAMAADLGELKNSITKGKGNIAGFLGEIVVRDFYNGDGISANTFDYDIIVKVDVKTKRCKSKPLAHYECSIAGFNTKQRCDAYIFARVLNNLSKAWILGFKGKDDYYNESIFHKKGDKDPSNNFTFHSDAYNMSISDLHKID